MNCGLSSSKKCLYTGTVFIFFLLLLESSLWTIGFMAGNNQSGHYNEILDGSTVFLCFGDSVTMGHNLPQEKAWPEQFSDLLSRAGGEKIKVINRAFDGADTGILDRKDTINALDKTLKKQQKPVALVMLGHIDLLGRGWRQHQIDTLPASEWKERKTTAYPTQNPSRLIRLVRWALINKIRSRKTSSSSNMQKKLEENLLLFQKRLKQREGRLYLMTYLIPGDASDRLYPNAAAQVDKVRDAQKKANQSLADFARKNEIGLIDIEFHTNAPNEWSKEWFLDHIHPTAHGQKEIANSTLKQLIAHGELPISMSR